MSANPNMNAERQMSKLAEHYASTRSKEEHVTIEWENLEYSVITKDSKNSKFMKSATKNNRILKNVSGRAESGQLLAIMGPTGCGKTSLLNALAARMPNTTASKTKLTGSITINGQPRKDDEFRRISGYVLQDDKMYPHLTVYETMMLAAHFYLANDVKQEAKDTLVMNVIDEMGLRKAKDTIIGDEKVRGVSGGERRRANIGAQLISDPAVLFLDEPTSGLDAFQANSVMESMKSLALNGRLVISVIHQPRSSIYEMFDRLMLLSCGRVMFLGDVHDAYPFFAATGNACPRNYNPSDFFLDVLSPDSRNPDVEKMADDRICAIGDAWERKIEGEDNNYALQNNTDIAALRSAGIQNNPARVYRNFRLLCWRSFAEQSREIPTIIIKLVVVSFFGLIIGGIYSNAGYDQAAISNRTGLLFVICLNQAFNGTISVLNSFPKEKIIVNRERSNRAYDTLSYFIAKFVVELPLNLMPCVIFSCIVYYMVGLNPLVFGQFIGIVAFTALTAISLGLVISAMVPSVEVALALGPPAIIIALLFGGFYINLSSLPEVANLIPYLSFLRWGFEALCVNEFQGETFTCGDTPITSCQTDGAQVLARLRFYGTVRSNLFGLGMVLIGFCVSAYVALLLSAITYMPLGHVGRGQKGRHADEPKVTPDTTVRKVSVDARTVGIEPENVVEITDRKNM